MKRLAERVLLRGGAATVARYFHRRRTLVLAYHNVVPDGADCGGDRSLHLPQRAFEAQLDLLVEQCEVVPLASVLGPPPPGAKRPRVAITFDDAYRGAVLIGLYQTARRGLPATMFIAPAFVGGSAFWWDVLCEPRGAGPAPEVRRRALEQLRGHDVEVRAWAARVGLTSREPQQHERVASEEELSAAARFAGTTFGSHSWSHARLTRLAAEELTSELARPLAWLRSRFPSAALPWLAYPYGLWDPAVEDACRALGYQAALAIEGGWVRGTVPPFTLPRLNVPAGITLDGLALRLAGLV